MRRRWWNGTHQRENENDQKLKIKGNEIITKKQAWTTVTEREESTQSDNYKSFRNTEIYIVLTTRQYFSFFFYSSPSPYSLFLSLSFSSRALLSFDLFKYYEWMCYVYTLYFVSIFMCGSAFFFHHSVWLSFAILLGSYVCISAVEHERV